MVVKYIGTEKTADDNQGYCVSVLMSIIHVPFLTANIVLLLPSFT